jgi:hypothetical protein
MIAPRCGFSDFEAVSYDHLIEQLPTVSVLELKGRLKVNPKDVEGGLWPAGLDARIELHGPNGFREFIEAGDDGTFIRRGLRAGTYCFKLSASGFRSAMGTVVIDPTAQQRDLLEIELMIAE